jgi:hypothetical protein
MRSRKDDVAGKTAELLGSNGRYRILEDARRYEEYAEVAQRAYDEELVDFFGELREESRGLAERAGKLLAQRLADGGVH